MKTYILKYPVYNSIDFPAGTVVSLLPKNSYDKYDTFIVEEGELKGQTGCVADGLQGWLLNDTEDNKKLYDRFSESMDRLNNELQILRQSWSNIPSAII